MDRRERYDPEDIEILMQERSFDELLEEERAYVLRHVSDRAEYEAMRSLLMHMRDDARDHEPIEADPAIRANVIQAFRIEQRPQWRIWLNSVGAALFPEEAMAMWRPALALAGLALIVVVSVVLVRQMGTENAELAEVRPAATEEKIPSKSEGLPVERDERTEAERTGAELASVNEVPNTISADVAEDAERYEGNARTRSLDQDLLTMDDLVTESSKGSDAQQHLDELEEKVAAVAPAPARKETTADSEVQRSSHVVTAEEMSRNMSVANATGKVRVQDRGTSDLFAAAGTASVSMADKAALLELVATGW